MAMQAFYCFWHALCFAPSFFCVFLLPIVDTLLAVVVTKARLLQKLSLCPFANCTKKQLFRRGYTSIFLLLSGSLFCAVFFCVFLLPIACTLLAVVVTKARLRQKLAGCASFANCTKKQLFRHGNASILLLLACSLFCAVFFLRFSFADCRHIASSCRNEGEITAKTQFVPLCKLYEKTTFSAWLYKHFPAFVRLFVLRRLFCIGKVFSVCLKRAQAPAQPTNEYLFFLFSAKAVRLAFLYFCFGQNFTS